MPARGRAEDFPALVATMRELDMQRASLPTRTLWNLRDLLGKLFGLGRIADRHDRPPAPLPIPGTAETTLASRLSEDVRETVAGVDPSTNTPFRPLYQLDDEYAAELSNKTVHGVLHLAWVPRGDGTYQGQLAVYVKPRGRWGAAYMAAIKPFRLLIVYPELLRIIDRMWRARTAASPTGS